jgi:citronellol/citronellal dehydrogenase
VIDTAAITILGDAVKPENCRTPEIMADAAHAVLCQSARHCTGHFYLDEDVLRATGERNFDQYAVKPGAPLLRDLFLDN